jgi:outer membrane beta-barrel protein
MSRPLFLSAKVASCMILSLGLSHRSMAADQSGGAAPSSAPTAAVATGVSGSDSSKSLADQMNLLSGGTNAEKTYAVHEQRSGNVGVYDIAAGAGVNTTGDVNLRSTDAMVRLKYHATNHLFVSLGHSQVKNQFNLSAKRRIDEDRVYPNVGFVTSRNDLSLGYNLIYGKARLTKDAMFYFDQYAALGAGMIGQTNTRENLMTPAMVADLGVSFWFGGRVSLAVGAKGYRFKEIRIASSGMTNHVIGYANLGMLVGGAG